MIEYIYFVKCPNCEDEHFYFFNDAKECAMSQLSKKPIITQTEVNRNDFGECIDSCDLGTVWSWEDMMNDVPADSEQTTFSKVDTVERDNCFDQEFDELDNSLEAPVERKPVPAGIAIESLVEEMEENEDTVECRVCEELHDKSNCHKDAKLGWVCEGCREPSAKLRTWICFFDGRDVGTVEAANEYEAKVKMMDEYPEYPYSLYDGCFWVAPEDDAESDTLTEASKYKDSIELHYDSLTTEITTRVIPATLEDPADYEEDEYTDEYDFEVDTDTIEEVLWNEFITEEDVADVPGGLEALEDEAAWKAFLDTHFEDLLEKYNDQLLEYFREDAEEAAREDFQTRYNNEADDWYYEGFEAPSKEMSEDISTSNTASSWSLQPVELEYLNLEVTVQGRKRDVDDWDEEETFVPYYLYKADPTSVAEVLWDLMTDEDVAEVPGGFEALEDDAAFDEFMNRNFDNLVEKYMAALCDHFKEYAREECEESHSFGESYTTKESKTFLEEFDDAETHKANLTDCPECGTVSYDMKEQYCINCGLGL